MHIDDRRLLLSDSVFVLQCSRPYRFQKNTKFGPLIYDFLLAINTNLPSILYRFQVMADYSSNFR